MKWQYNKNYTVMKHFIRITIQYYLKFIIFINNTNSLLVYYLHLTSHLNFILHRYLKGEISWLFGMSDDRGD